MIYRLVHELATDGIDVAVACRVLRVSRSGFYEWRGRAPSARAVADAQLTATIAEIAQNLGIAESCLRRWLKQDDIDTGRAEGLSTDERAELVRLRRENRVQAMEIEILKRARAQFAREAFSGRG